MSLKKLLVMFLMICSAMAAIYLEPTHKIAVERESFVLEKIIPSSFRDWEVVEESSKAIVNPQQEVMINKIYNQTLSRTYQKSSGERVMLVIAYGENQSDNTELHYPEVCYPAQGFQISNHKSGAIILSSRNVPTTKLVAKLNGRVEPITYWTTIGNKVVRRGFDTKLEKLRYGFKGIIPDGMLFRVSSIGDESQYLIQEKFISDLMANIEEKYLQVFIGSSLLNY